MANPVTDCSDCAQPMLEERVDMPMRALPDVLLRAVVRHRCPTCGTAAVDIPDLRGLVGAVAHLLAAKPSRLTGREVRLLRNHLGWSFEECARRLGVTPETQSRWENGHQPVNAVADRLLRTLVLIDAGIEPAAAFLDLDFPGPGTALRAVARHDGVRWSVEPLDDDVRAGVAEAVRRGVRLAS